MEPTDTPLNADQTTGREDRDLEPKAQTAALPLSSDGDDEKPARERAPLALQDVRPEMAALGIHSFDDLPMHESVREGVRKIGWAAPTPVQKLCLPYTLRGRDVAGFAQTGTGKTAVFLLTIVNRLLTAQAAGLSRDGKSPRAVVLAPTRELAMQIEQDAEPIFKLTGLSTMAVFGGIDYEKQARTLKEGVDVIFATPGRLTDYVKKGLVDLTNIQVFVCDEADRMFDMGFIEDVEFFLERIPETSQKLLFSATTNEQVKELAFEYLESPEYISVTPETITPERIEQHAIHCHATDKLKVLLGLLKEHNPDCALIFTNTKLTAEWLHFKLVHNGIDADLISGDLPQKKRIRLIQVIKEGKLKALVATDVASRGLHISRVTHVYNFDLPEEAANYVHRVGRTARAGAKGFAYSLVCDDYGQNLAQINDLLGPTVALRTEWPDEKYMGITDRAGNPFEERYAARRERETRRSGGFESERGPRLSGGSRDGRPGRRDRQEARGGQHGERRPDRKGGGRPGGQQEERDFGDQKRGGRGGRQRFEGGQRQGQRQVQGKGPRVGDVVSSDQASKSLFGMIKRIFKALFGWGKAK